MAVSVDEVEVLAQNRAFYAAFRQRDLDSMDQLWATQAKVACVHPGWQPIRGRAQVMASWRAILGQSSVPQIRCEDASAHVLGDTAFVLCEEVLGEGRLVATNVFVREEDDWRLVHHQAGPMAPGAQAETSDDFQAALGSGLLGAEALGGLPFGHLGEAEGDDSEDDLDAVTLDLDDEDELLEFGDDEALAGGGTALPRERGLSALTDSESHRQLDDTEAPELFLNLSGPASRRLLN